MRAKVLTLGLICLLIPLFVLGDYNFWQELFKEPIERMFIIMKDGRTFKHDNSDEKKIYISAGELEETLKNLEKPYKIKDIAIIIHNHFIEYKFSPDDEKFYWDLKARGFNGLFLLYCHRTNKTYCLEDKKKGRLNESKKTNPLSHAEGGS